MYGLIGKKLSHSYSKIIHEKLSDMKYSLIETDDLDTLFKEKKFKGLNVTIPYKQECMKYLDEIDDAAKKIGAVNTITNDNGHLKGYNTDYHGLKALLKYNKITIKNKKVVIIGNGASSKTITVLCNDLGATNVRLVATLEKINDSDILLSDQESIYDANVLINATPIGMYPNNDTSSPILMDNYKDLEACVDLVYNPLYTDFLLNAKKRNLKASNGLYMLVYQAYVAHKYFIKRDIDESKINKIYKDLVYEMTNIVFIGMPMSGKTTLAKYLSKKINLKIVDIDAYIEKSAKCSIPTIFKNHGEDYFRKIETQSTLEIAREHNKIISCGGGIVTNPTNMKYLKQNGIIIFLNRTLFDLKKTKSKNRPLLKDINSLNILYKSRINLYFDYSDITIDSNMRPFGKIAEDIKEQLYEFLSNKWA